MQPTAHVLNFLSDEAVSPKSAELVTVQNKVHPGVCRTVSKCKTYGIPTVGWVEAVTFTSILKFGHEVWANMQIQSVIHQTFTIHYIARHTEKRNIWGLVKTKSDWNQYSEKSLHVKGKTECGMRGEEAWNFSELSLKSSETLCKLQNLYVSEFLHFKNMLQAAMTMKCFL